MASTWYIAWGWLCEMIGGMGRQTMELNARAWRLCERLIARAAESRIGISTSDCGTRLIDCGVHAAGGLDAGLAVADICVSGLAAIDIVPGRQDVWSGPAVSVRTDHPVAACLASQYAGWKLSVGEYFAIGSGPMRAAWGQEDLFDAIGFREQASRVVGVLESNRLPDSAVCIQIAGKCRVAPDQLVLLVARTASLAGSIQVVARSVETALQKLHELHFDVGRVRSAFGVAPLPPVAHNDLGAIGRTNDAVLYGAEVTLWVECDDETLLELGPRTPSSSSKDYGRPFGDLFRDYQYDFYQVDPLLFSPAQVTFCNLTSGRVHRFGELRGDILAQSFGSGS